MNVFGKLTLDALKHDPLQMGASISMIVAPLICIALLFYFSGWRWLWKNWITTVDPKRIGIMYILASLVMLVKGLSDAILMRAQQMVSVGDSYGFLTADHFQQIFSSHGTNMIFFVAMGVIFGLMNLLIPLQIGARDVAFPFINALSFWLFVGGASLLNMAMIVGDFSAAGWIGYPPLSETRYNPGVGVDYWIWSIQISGAGSWLSGINFFVTILKMRCPGMTLMRMPLFTWSSLVSIILILFAFPILTATLSLLSFDRSFGMHLFTPEFGGNPMMYVNLFWAWGHPEVYILVLPAFGIFSEVVATFSQKRLFGYASMVWALFGITILSFLVWLHHFFTMGASANVNAFFGIMTMLIAVPTGVKIFNWLFTMYRGKVLLTTPMLWFLAFVFIFTTGGMTGVLLSVAPIDFQLHNSLFLIAHFHSMIIGGVLFAFFAGFTYWFPKFTGFMLNEKLGRYAFWCWFIGFLLAFMPLYVLGAMGATRRLDHYDAGLGWQPWFLIAGIGALFVTIGVTFQVAQILLSIIQRKKNRDLTGDPWHGRTLEWSTASPPPEYNFAVIPTVIDRDAFWTMKETKGHKTQTEKYEDIHIPKNTPLGFYIAEFAFLFCFAAIWEITWLMAVSAMGFVICLIQRLTSDNTEFVMKAEEVEKHEMEIKRMQKI